MFKKLGLRAKLILAFASTAAILAVVCFLSYTKLTETVAYYNHVVKVNYPNYVALSQVIDNGRRLNIITARVTGSVFTQAEIKGLEDELQSAVSGIEAAKKDYLQGRFVSGEEPLWNETYERLKVCIEYVKKAIEMSRGSNPEELRKRDVYAENYNLSVRVPYREAMAKLMAFQSKEAEARSRIAENGAKKGEQLLILLGVGGVVSALLIGVLISLSLSRTMTEISQKLFQGADEVASASAQISATAEQLSSSSVEQASAIQETASSVEEMSSMVRKNADNAKRSADTARDGMETAETGKQVISDMLKAMGEIDAATREIADVVKLIGRIENKTKVIDDIVFKTQLLSFNASVEAARAGEHGKGFAVVAEEVGNLAQMSGNAAREISDMLSESLERVDRMITSSKQKVEVGLTVGKRCGEVLDDLVEKVSEINDMAHDIAGASDEQARGVIEINKAMTQMDQMTQQNSSAAQQSASSSEELAHQAELMRASVGSLLKLLNGSKADVQVASMESLAPRRKHAPAQKPPLSRVKAKHTPVVPSADHAGFDDAA